MVRLARDTGSMSDLYPPGVSSLLDLPAPLYDAIRKALIFAGFDEIPDEDRPPREIWLNSRKLREFFAEVRRKRKAGVRGDDWPSEGDIEDPVTNPLATELRKSVG
jgi:hypothetical protein